MPRRRAPGHALEAQVALRPETERFGHAEGSPRVGRGVPAECRTSVFSRRVASMASGGGQTVGGLFSILGPFEPFPAQAASSSSPSATRIRNLVCTVDALARTLR